MPSPIAIEPVTPPFRIDESGAVRVGNTRVSLGSVIEAYCEGDTAEVIADAFQSLTLADVHDVIAYYLKHRAQVEAYMDARRHKADELRRLVEAMPGHSELVEKLRGIKLQRG